MQSHTAAATKPAAAGKPADASCAADPQACYESCGAKVVSCLQKLNAAPAGPAEAIFVFAHGCLCGLGFKPFCARTNSFCEEGTLPRFAAADGRGFEQRYRFVGHGFGAPTEQESGRPLSAAAPQLKQSERAQGAGAHGAGAESDYKADDRGALQQGGQQQQQQQLQLQERGAGGGALAPAESHTRSRQEAVLDVVLYGVPQGSDGIALHVRDLAGAAASRGHEERRSYQGGGGYSMASYAFASSSQGKSSGETFKFADWLNDCCTTAGARCCAVSELYKDPAGLCQKLNETILHDIIPDKPPQVAAATNFFRSFFGSSGFPRLGLF